MAVAGGACSAYWVRWDEKQRWLHVRSTTAQRYGGSAPGDAPGGAWALVRVDMDDDGGRGSGLAPAVAGMMKIKLHANYTGEARR